MRLGDKCVWTRVFWTISLAACGDDITASGARPTEPPPEEVLPSASPCRLGPAHELTRLSPGSRPSVVTAELNGIVTIGVGRGSTLQLQAVTDDAAPEGAPVERAIPGADGVVELFDLGSQTAVLVEVTCGGGRCLRAHTHDRAGAVTGTADAPASGAPHTLRRAWGNGSFVLARSYAPRRSTALPPPPRLDRLSVDEAGAPTWTTHPLGVREEGGGSELPVEVLRAAVGDDGAWAVLWRRGAVEDQASRVFLSRSDGDVHVEALHHAVVIEAIAIEDAVIHVVAGFEMSRPTLLSIGADGEPVRRPVELVAGAPIPEPFTRTLRASLEGGAGTIVVHVRNAAGDAVGEPLVLARHPNDRQVPADIVRRGPTSFVVAWATRSEGWKVEARSLRCRAPTARLE